ncbi:SPOSA6832_03178, partial [Sporobolomyces salmonicolor]
MQATTELALNDVSARQSEQAAQAVSPTPASNSLDKRALWSLLAQHLSRAYGAREQHLGSAMLRVRELPLFVIYSLFLIRLFPNTTLQPSIFGFFTTGAAIVFAGTVGGFVDRFSRLRFVRSTIVAQKATVAIAYAIFLICFLELKVAVKEGGKQPVLDVLFALVTLLSMLLNLATIGISVAVERDWVTTIAAGDGATLTKLNTYLRRIDLLSKLVAPLFVSLLTTAVSYVFAAAFLLGFALVSLCFEFIWIEIVYRRLPILVTADKGSTRPPLPEHETRPSLRSRLIGLGQQLRRRIVAEGQDWVTFVKAPVFFSCLAISLLYLTVLSWVFSSKTRFHCSWHSFRRPTGHPYRFDGSMLAYLKAHDYSDAFVAGMRGIGVVTGLMGTIVMPMLEKRIGLVRAGSWSIWFEVISLIPAVLAFFVGAPATGQRGLPYNSALLFTGKLRSSLKLAPAPATLDGEGGPDDSRLLGMAVSRIGLWSFDLCQLKELQEALNDHPRRNTMHFSLQNMLDLVKYIVTIILSRPAQFKWAVVISFASVVTGGLCYLKYVHRERGHIVHLEWTEHLLKKRS